MFLRLMKIRKINKKEVKNEMQESIEDNQDVPAADENQEDK